KYTIFYLRKTFKHKAQGTINRIFSLETYVAKITTYLRCIKPYITSLAVSAIELRIIILIKP
ncbi:hypothetical protein K458DRAFT_318031, partial [Lentithecium fluviatile CBS 122367]